MTVEKEATLYESKYLKYRDWTVPLKKIMIPWFRARTADKMAGSLYYPNYSDTCSMIMILRGDEYLDSDKDDMTYQYSWNVRIWSKLLHLNHPLLNVLEAYLVGHIKDDDDPQGPPVAAGQDWSVPLLATSVPNLQ